MHPNKKTGLIVVGGAASVGFLNTGIRLFPGEKTMIRKGVFHQTTNYLNTDLILLEIETPNKKKDIVRLEDDYGRAHKPLEYGQKEYKDAPAANILNGKKHKVGHCYVQYFTFECSVDIDMCPSDMFMVITGGVYSKDIPVVGMGDIISKANLLHLAEKFQPSGDISVVGIHHELP
jgi:hypothetical protein